MSDRRACCAKKGWLIIIYTVFIIVAVVGALPLLLVGWFTLNPVVGDHFVLANRQIHDDRLGSVIAPNAWGHDANGFRNPHIPEHADLVTLGDSQTWGINAAYDQTWPFVVGDLSGQSVYNMASIGFGTVEYWVLLDDALVDLAPKTVIVGFYFGNDLYDTYESIYHFEPYAAYRDPDAGPELFDNSVGQLANQIGISTPDELYSGGGVDTKFTIAYRTLAVNLDDPHIAEGLRITKMLLVEMQAQAYAGGADLLVVLIPTKEHVYAEQVARIDNADLDWPAYQRLVDLEERAYHEIETFLEMEGIAFVDVLPELVMAVESGKAVYRDATDGHPTPKGYEVIAEVVYAALDPD